MNENRGRVLHCEEHDDTRVLMTYMLEQAGFHVTHATTAADCLKQAERGRFDLYLLEQLLPEDPGVTLCEAIRRFDPETPILFYSSRALPKEREATIAAGAQDYLIKPIDIFNVADHVAKWIGSKDKS